MSEKRRVIKQFEWFEVQTKVREIIGEALRPIEKKVLSNSSAIFKLEEKGKEETLRLQQLTKMVNDDPKIFEHGIFQRIEQKIQSSNIHIQELESKMRFLEGFINNKIEVLDGQLKESGESLNAINDFKLYLKTEVDSQNDKLVQSMQNVFSNYDQLNQSITALSLRMDQVTSSNQALSLKLEAAEVKVSEGTGRIDSSLKAFELKIKELELSGELSGKDVALVMEEMKRVERFQKYTRRLQEHIQNLSNQINNLEYKLQVIHPMGVLAQINQYAHHVLPAQLHNNISIYFYNRYRHLAQAIIDNEVDRKLVVPSRQEQLSLIRLVHRQATKRVFHLKKEHLRCQGINIDQLSHDKRQELLQKLEITEETGVVGPEDSPRNVKKGKQQDEAGSRNLVESQQRSLRQLRQRIQVELKDSKRFIVEMEQVFRKIIEQMEQKLETCKNDCEHLKQDALLQEKYYKDLQMTLSQTLSKNKNDIRQIQTSMITALDALCAIREIELQDETDRQSIALLGIREHHRDLIKETQDYITKRHVPVQLKDQCLSCSGNPNYFNQFFKMACLTYQSTPVKHNNRLYQRKDLLELIYNNIEKTKVTLSGQNSPQATAAEQKTAGMRRYESSQMPQVPARDTRSASDTFAIRNLSSSQDVGKRKENDTPRLLDAQELAESLMGFNRRRMSRKQRESGYREERARKQAESLERRDYMTKLSGFFRGLKKQNETFIK